MGAASPTAHESFETHLAPGEDTQSWWDMGTSGLSGYVKEDAAA